ncbi:MAG: hypothetical protein RL662_241 [Bacteroidota bacterium]|jgi:TrmH family RNA methyltransferase
MGLSINRLKYIQSLKEKKGRDQYGTFVAEGNKMVNDLLPILRCELLVATSDFIKKIDIKSLNIRNIIEVSKGGLERASFLRNPQQVLAVFFQPTYCLEAEDLQTQLSLALDNIQDPGNLGTIIRIADWFGIDNIICSEDTVDVYNPKVVQATMGALARVKVHYVNLVQWMSKVNDIPIYGTFLDGDSIYQTDIAKFGIIVMGNEGKGICTEIEKLVDNRLYIPNFPTDRNTSESLNVAVSTAIICNEFRRVNF